jgi:hypothetical protein
MTNATKTVLKMVVLAALLSPAVYADGDMGSGGKTCPEGQETCLTGDMGSGGLTSYDVYTTQTLEGDMGSGGLAVNSESYLDTTLRSIYSLFGWTM